MEEVTGERGGGRRVTPGERGGEGSRYRANDSAFVASFHIFLKNTVRWDEENEPRNEGRLWIFVSKNWMKTSRFQRSRKGRNTWMRKKKKRKGSKMETRLNFPGGEKVKFGEVVDAPPKLSFPKVKSHLDVSHEWLRKEVIENYRNIKGWKTRPVLSCRQF